MLLLGRKTALERAMILGQLGHIEFFECNYVASSLKYAQAAELANTDRELQADYLASQSAALHARGEQQGETLALEQAVALYRRHRADQTERAAIDRAKALLIRSRGWSEPDAHRWLRRRAMDRGKRIADIAAAVLAGDEA